MGKTKKLQKFTIIKLDNKKGGNPIKFFYEMLYYQ